MLLLSPSGQADIQNTCAFVRLIVSFVNSIVNDTYLVNNNRRLILPEFFSPTLRTVSPDSMLHWPGW